MHCISAKEIIFLERRSIRPAVKWRHLLHAKSTHYGFKIDHCFHSLSSALSTATYLQKLLEWMLYNSIFEISKCIKQKNGPKNRKHVKFSFSVPYRKLLKKESRNLCSGHSDQFMFWRSKISNCADLADRTKPLRLKAVFVPRALTWYGLNRG